MQNWHLHKAVFCNCPRWAGRGSCAGHVHASAWLQPLISRTTLGRNYDRCSEQLFASAGWFRWIVLRLLPPTFLLNGLVTASIKRSLALEEAAARKETAVGVSMRPFLITLCQKLWRKSHYRKIPAACWRHSGSFDHARIARMITREGNWIRVSNHSSCSTELRLQVQTPGPNRTQLVQNTPKPFIYFLFLGAEHCPSARCLPRCSAQEELIQVHPNNWKPA